MVCCLCCFVDVRVGLNLFECVFIRALLCDVLWFDIRGVFVLMCVCVLCLMSLHAVCESSYDDVWCSRCVLCLCDVFVCLCGLFVNYCVMLCGVRIFCLMRGFVCVVCCCCLSMLGCFDGDILCGVAWCVGVRLLL